MTGIGSIKDVESWARGSDVKLDEEDAEKLRKQKVDGASLIEMAKNETEALRTRFLSHTYNLPDGPATKLAGAIITRWGTKQIGGPTEAPQRLWQDLYNASIDGDFLKMKQANPKRLPFPGNLLFIRESYTEIYKIIFTSTDYSRFLLLGNPGIGKSCFLIYLLYRLLLERQTVVLRRSGDLLCYLFHNGQVTSSDNIAHYDGILNVPSTWYLVDTVPDPGAVVAKTVLTCSPRRETYKLFERYQQRVTLYLPIWDSNELKCLQKNVFTDVTYYVMRERFGKVGGIPRLIFSKEDLDDEITKAMGRSTFDKCTAATGVLEGGDDLSHVLIHILPQTDNFQKYSVDFASKYISGKLVKLFEQRELQKFRNFLGASGQIPIGGSLRGGLFEGWAHNILQKGGTFAIRKLGVKTNENELIIPPCVEQWVEDFTPTGKNIYYKPTSDNFPCVDAWIPNIGFFQMTVSRSHPIKEKGLASLFLKPHDMKKFYFVVPDDKEFFQNFPRQTFKVSNNTSSNRTTGKSVRVEDVGIIADQLEQYVLQIKVN